MLDLSRVDCVVDSKAFCERVANHVSTDFDLSMRWFSVVRHWFSSSDIDGDEHRIQTGDDWVNVLIHLDAHTMSNFCSECGFEDVFFDFPPFRRCHDVEVDLLKSPAVSEIMHWLVACELSNPAVVGEVCLRIGLPHSEEFLGRIILVVCLFDGCWQFEEIVYI